jgi:2,4-dienoyl-CoA reductase-like NADH-dependent reductase (Old Yellow Enzyme family)
MPQDDPKQRQPIDLAFEKLGRLEAKNRIARSTKTIYFESVPLVFTDRLLTYYSKAFLS